MILMPLKYPEHQKDHHDDNEEKISFSPQSLPEPQQGATGTTDPPASQSPQQDPIDRNITPENTIKKTRNRIYQRNQRR